MRKGKTPRDEKTPSLMPIGRSRFIKNFMEVSEDTPVL